MPSQQDRQLVPAGAVRCESHRADNRLVTVVYGGVVCASLPRARMGQASPNQCYVCQHQAELTATANAAFQASGQSQYDAAFTLVTVFSTLLAEQRPMCHRHYELCMFFMAAFAEEYARGGPAPGPAPNAGFPPGGRAVPPAAGGPVPPAAGGPVPPGGAPFPAPGAVPMPTPAEFAAYADDLRRQADGYTQTMQPPEVSNPYGHTPGPAAAQTGARPRTQPGFFGKVFRGLGCLVCGTAGAAGGVAMAAVTGDPRAVAGGAAIGGTMGAAVGWGVAEAAAAAAGRVFGHHGRSRID
jgi:hypothetical protein